MKRLFRTEEDRKLSGVCGGLAVYFSIDPTIVRLAMVALFIFTGFFPVLLGYIIASFIIPNESDLIS